MGKKAILIFLMLVLFSFPALGNPIYSTWELLPAQVSGRVWSGVEIIPHRELVMGFLFEGRLHSPEEREMGLDLFYMDFPLGSGEIRLGKFRPAWETEDFSSIMLSGKAPGMVGIKFSGEIAGLDYQRFATWLDSNRGRMFGHRLEITPVDGFSLGLKEVALFSRPFEGEWVCYVPFYPLYLTKYLPGYETSRYDNHNVGLDVKFNLDWVRLYGDLHVTEWPLGPEKTNPPIYGLQMGFVFPKILESPFTLKGEYLRTMNFLYSHRQEETYYEHQGRLLGTHLGPDAESLGLEVTYDWCEFLDIRAQFRLERKGEGQPGDYFSGAPDARENIFMTGVVENRLVTGGGFSWQANPRVLVDIYLEMEFLENADHVEGEKGSRTAGTLGLTWTF